MFRQTGFCCVSSCLAFSGLAGELLYLSMKQSPGKRELCFESNAHTVLCPSVLKELNPAAPLPQKR